MSKIAHTPGPWQWYWREEEGEAKCGVFYEERPGHAYAVARCPRYVKQEQWQANAHLISAAPDLLAALEAMTADFKATADSGDCGFYNAEDCEIYVTARAAISKAKGEA